MKLPAFQFYPGDWLKDTRPLSLAEKGAWIEILVALWDSQIRGVLTHKAVGWARMLGCTADQAEQTLSTLRDLRLGEIEKTGDVWLVASRRIIRDEIRRRRDVDRKSNGVSEDNYRKAISASYPGLFRFLSESNPPATEDEDEDRRSSRKGGLGGNPEWRAKTRLEAIEKAMLTVRESAANSKYRDSAGNLKPQWKTYYDGLLTEKRSLVAVLTGVEQPPT